jgi:hypothetical protein
MVDILHCQKAHLLPGEYCATPEETLAYMKTAFFTTMTFMEEYDHKLKTTRSVLKMFYTTFSSDTTF